MEILLIIGVIWFIRWVLMQLGSDESSSAYRESSGSSNYNTSNQTNSNTSSYDDSFQVFASIGEKRFGEDDYDVIFVRVKGRLNNFATKRIKTLVLLSDTSKERLPILSTLDIFQVGDSGAFGYQTDIQELPYTDAVFSKKHEILSIPIEALIFPKKGKRKIEVKVIVADEFNNVQVGATTEVYYQNHNKGYIDLSEDRDTSDELIIRLAVLVAGADDAISKPEVDEIQEYKRMISYDSDGELDDARMDKLDAIIRDTVISMTTKSIEENLEKTCKKLKSINDLDVLYEAVSLLLRIAAVDGEFDKKEHDFIKKIAEKVGLEDKLYQKLVDKHIALSGVNIRVENASLIGVDDGMSDDEKRKKLREEYKKWSQRVTHNDENIRKQASEMLEKIALERAKL